jgi:DNA repair photolyase
VTIAESVLTFNFYFRIFFVFEARRKTPVPMRISATSFLEEEGPRAETRAGKSLTGIAKLAAESRGAAWRNEVDYRSIETRSILNRVNGTRATFDWSINPYRGCEFGCQYCYARYTHEFMELRNSKEFERKIFLKTQAAGQLRRELRSGKVKPGEEIVLGAATDPYQPAEKTFGLTRAVLEVLAESSGYRVGIITKGDLILRDLELWQRVALRHAVSINMTVTTVDIDLARELEPRAVTPRRRLEAVRQLRQAGLQAGVFLMPVMPGINDDTAGLEAVAQAAAEAGADFLTHSTLFLTPLPKEHFFAYLKAKRPELLLGYQSGYRRSIDLPVAVRDEVRGRMSRARAKYGLPRSKVYPAMPVCGIQTEQMSFV